MIECIVGISGLMIWIVSNSGKLSCEESYWFCNMLRFLGNNLLKKINVVRFVSENVSEFVCFMFVILLMWSVIIEEIVK